MTLGSKEFTDEIAAVARNASMPEPSRFYAIRALQSLRGEIAMTTIKELVAKPNPNSIRRIAISALARLDIKLATEPLFQNEIDAAWRSVIGDDKMNAKIAAALPEKLSQKVANIGLQIARSKGSRGEALVAALIPFSGESVTKADWSPAKAKELLELVSTEGDPERGETIYRQEHLQCIKCHAIGGVGGKVGPDMTSLGASAPIDYLIESMFDPNAKIKENFHSTIVLTEDGRLLAGIESGSTDEEVIIRDETNKLIRIPRAEIENQKEGKSLMPAGLLDRVSQRDQIDLIRFMSELGKPGDYDASRQNVARSVEIFAGTHRSEQDGNQNVIQGKLIPGWKRINTRVKSTIDNLTKQPLNTTLIHVYIRATIKAAQDTEANFLIDGAELAEMWIDGKPVPTENKNKFSTQIKNGWHTVLVRLDARALPNSVAIRSDDVTFLAE
jgi:putative heme-binding domain-containing protein